MGSYAHCWFENFNIGSSKGDVELSLIALFRETDKNILKPPHKGVPKILESWKNDFDDEPIVFYKTSAHVIRDRLDVLGYTFESATKAFEVSKNKKIEELKERIAEMRHEKAHYDQIIADYKSEIEILEKCDAKIWAQELSEIRESPPDRAPYYTRREARDGTLRGYMLSEDWYGLPGLDVNVALRLLLESATENESVIYDITDLVASDYLDPEDDLVEHAIFLSAAEYASQAKTIILTEGKTDARILKISLELLFPHLSDYYSFMDFELARPPGGVGNLVNLVKSFSGAGVVNNVIALFDNDTAAQEAIETLDAKDLPSNMRVLRLPNVPLLKKYPTLGPGGREELDVNGTSASIELFLGKDVLTDGTGLIPVQWTGFSQKLQRYQGEVTKKREIHERFYKKIEAAQHSDQQLDDTWDQLRAIFYEIFHAFDKRNMAMILETAIHTSY